MNVRDDRSALLAGIVAEIIELRRRGEQPDLAAYQRLHPALAGEIESQVLMIELLEGSHGDSRGGNTMDRILSHLPLPLQRLLFLRNFEKRPWKEIARSLGQSEGELRTAHARCLREILDRFGYRGVDGVDGERGGSSGGAGFPPGGQLTG